MARRYGDNYRMLHDKTHVSLFSDFGLSDLLEDEGFLVKNIKYPYFYTKYFNSKEIAKLFKMVKLLLHFMGIFLQFTP